MLKQTDTQSINTTLKTYVAPTIECYPIVDNIALLAASGDNKNTGGTSLAEEKDNVIDTEKDDF